MVIAETEEVVIQQRVNEHKNILDMIDMLNKRLVKLENAVPVTLLVTLENLETRLSKIENDDKGTARNAIGDKALLMKLTTDIESNRIKINDNRDRLYTIEYNIKDIDSCLESIQVILARIGKHVDKDVLYKEEDNNDKN
jgi:hypothetical protein|tara:strand:+ start:58 stop:477 length:420 start_codon:yes stop_codon:yes gene_type:complete